MRGSEVRLLSPAPLLSFPGLRAIATGAAGEPTSDAAYTDAVTSATSTVAAPQRQAWWARAFAAIPLPLLYGLSSLLAFIAWRVVSYRRHVVLENLRIAFPELDVAGIEALTRQYYRSSGDVLVEVMKSPGLSAGQIRARVRFVNLELIRERLGRGRPVLLIAAHQCNWEWMLQALVLELGYPVDAAYKPLVDPWAEREMQKLRTRFGAHLVPAQQLLAELIRRRQIVRAIAMVADQEPVASEQKHWTRFLNRDSAFFLGGEEIARKLRYATYFMKMRRISRGHYEMEFELMVDDTERLPGGEFTERYVQLVETQIRESPADWPWSHKRWRLKRPLYSG